MKKAIALPYTCEQNEPSHPLKQIIELPDNIAQRDKHLKMLFLTHVCELDDEDAKNIEVYEGEKGDYGDLVVSYGDDMFLYITYIKE